MNDQTPIAVRNLSHWFGEGDARKQALFDITLDIQKGSLTILMGPSGSGKTTLLTLMACLRDIEAGNVSLLGRRLESADSATKTSIRRELGFIFQAHNLHESLTALQNVEMALQVWGAGDSAKHRKAATHLLTVLGLKDRLSYLPGNLSGGQNQRVAVARALVNNPAVVFADEPTAALDKQTGRKTVELLKRMGSARNTTTIMVTHDNRILDLADRIIEMEEGRIISDSKP